jgi:hypothetical protein
MGGGRGSPRGYVAASLRDATGPSPYADVRSALAGEWRRKVHPEWMF